MQRLHVSLKVNDLPDSVKFYSTLFGSGPSMSKVETEGFSAEEANKNQIIFL